MNEEKLFRKKIVIGTANFGAKYGFRKNKNLEANLILDFLKKKKLNYLDTSASYYKAESIIGKKKNNFEIITKNKFIFKKKISSKKIKSIIRKKIENSLNRLKKKKIYAFLIQKSEIMLTENGPLIYKTLKEFKNLNKIQKIGVSCYDLKTLMRIVRNYQIDIVQLPFNLLNNELNYSEILNYLKKKNIEIHIRSVFLQGLLLADIDDLPKKFNKFKKILKLLNNFYQKHNITALQACLKYVLRFKKIDKIVIGVDNISQLKNILNVNLNFKYKKIPEIKLNNKNLTNPLKW